MAVRNPNWNRGPIGPGWFMMIAYPARGHRLTIEELKKDKKELPKYHEDYEALALLLLLEDC